MYVIWLIYGKFLLLIYSILLYYDDCNFYKKDKFSYMYINFVINGYRNICF